MPVHRILICRTGGIGDVIHTLPLVKYLRKKYKNASIEYLTSESIAALLSEHCPFINKVWSFNKKQKKEIACEIVNSGRKIDYFFNLHSSLSFFFFNLFNIRAKKYFGYKKDNSFHAVVNFARTFDKSLSAMNLDSNTLYVKDSSEILLKHNLKENKYICLVPGVGSERPHRAWLFENWLSLTKKYLTCEKDFKVVFLGGKDEEKIISNKLPGFKGRALNLTGKLDLCEVAEIISSSYSLISCDTGLLHIASALSTKVIGLFGPTLPLRSGPFTGNYQIINAKNCKCQDDLKKCRISISGKHPGYCMNNLSVDEVLSLLTNDLVSI